MNSYDVKVGEINLGYENLRTFHYLKYQLCSGEHLCLYAILLLKSYCA